MMTFFAPASICGWAFSLSAKIPVDSITTSTPRSPHGRSPGLRSESTASFCPSTLIPPRTALTDPPNLPWTESFFRRCASVSKEPRSFTATNSIFAPESLAARKKFRPILPNPLIPTRMAMFPSYWGYIV